MMRSVGLIGGTGPEGRGLAARFAVAGVDVIIGSRSAGRGEEAARAVSELAGRPVSGAANADAATAEIVVVTIPYAAQAETLSPLASAIGDKVVVSTVVPLAFGRGPVGLIEVAAGSAAAEVQALLPPARVAGAFHNLSARHLLDVAHAVEGDVIVCCDDAAALAEVVGLAALIKDVRGVNGGPLANCRYVEALTALLVNINRVNKAETNVRIVGL